MSHSRSAQWLSQLRKHQVRISERLPYQVEGRLTRIVGMTLEAVGCQSAIGGRCIIGDPGSEQQIEAEVVGFSR